MIDSDIDELYERSKDDRAFIAGSEIRASIGTLRTQLSEARATIEEQQLRLEVLYDGTESTPALVKIARLEMVIEERDGEIERWKQVAEDAACASTKAEACTIVEAALTPKGED
jgi:hypothetical protein